MKLDDINNFRRADWPYTQIDRDGVVHVFTTRAAKRKWNKQNNCVSDNNPLHIAQNPPKAQRS